MSDPDIASGSPTLLRGRRLQRRRRRHNARLSRPGCWGQEMPV